MLAPPETRRGGPPQATPEIAKSSVQQKQGIKLPVALQALRDEIRILDRYKRDGLLNQLDCDARLDEWRISYPPGMDRYDKLALLSVWDDDMAAETIVRGWEARDESQPAKPARKEYRTPQSTIDAFFGWVVRQDEAYQRCWLAEHPKDEAYLRKLLREKSK
jgi:hypothetical protein